MVFSETLLPKAKSNLADTGIKYNYFLTNLLIILVFIASSSSGVKSIE